MNGACRRARSFVSLHDRPSISEWPPNLASGTNCETANEAQLALSWALQRVAYTRSAR